MSEDSVEVMWSDGSKTDLPILWLRDNCTCHECRVVQTTEKKFVLADVSVDLQPNNLEMVGGELRVTWQDGHVSIYSHEFIIKSSESNAQEYVHWGHGYVPVKTDYLSFIDDDDIALLALQDFLKTGAMILHNTPEHIQILEDLHVRLGPMREMEFARIHEVVVDPSGYNVAHTNLALPPHNDFASMNWPPSVQALHMLTNECEGGETVIVDGWAIAKQLRKDRPECFESLCQFEVPFRMFSATTETFATNPLIKLDNRGNVSHLRYSNQLMQTLNPTKPGIKRFYRAYHELSRRLLSEQAKAVFRLNSGECLLVAGHRVLHARQAFVATGRRHLQDAYYEHDHIRNHVSVLERQCGRKLV